MKVGRIWGFSSIQFKPFSLAEMAEVELIVEDEIKCLKKEIKSLQKDLGRADVAKENLLTFEMLDKYPHITQQQAWPWIWENVDALYTFIDQIPTWVVDDSVMAIWVSGRQGPSEQLHELGFQEQRSWHGADAVKSTFPASEQKPIFKAKRCTPP